MLHIGCHLSSADGYLAMAKIAVSIGADTFQFFTRNPRGGAAKAIDPADVAAFIEFAGQHSFAPLVAHSPYTLNPCSADASVRRFARETFADDLARLEYTPGNYYNFHPGSHVKQGVEVGIGLTVDLLNTVLKPEQSTRVLIETMSGKGSEIGSTFEQIRAIIDGVDDKLRPLLGVCLDTCHIWDGGYDVAGSLDAVVDDFERVIGLDRLCAIHLNDSKNVFGARKDRHEKLGEGFIGFDALARVVCHPKLRGLVFILETPNELDGYAAEISRLKAVCK